MEWFRQAGRAAADQLESMPPVARWTLISLVAALLVGAVLLSKSSQLGGGTYLFREPLPASQLPAVEAALAKAGLKDFQWEGQRLLVPSAFKDRYLAALLDADVPPRDFGQLLDAAIEAGSPFESREQKTQRIRNARQRVLAQIIAEMKGVESARVLYDQGDAGGIRGGKILTASVSVTCDGNQSLSLKQVRAIRNLVASAIAGLEVHQVSVTDLNTGRNYAGVKFVDPRWLAELRDEHQKRLEQDWRQDILARIDWIVGVNANVKVRLRQETSPDEEGDPQWQPAEIKVNLLVPQAYVIKVWRQRYHIPDDDRAPITPSRDVTELARELAVHLKSHVADMVPSGVDLDLEISLQDDLAAKGEDAATGAASRATAQLPLPAVGVIGLMLSAIVGMLMLRWLQANQVAARPEPPVTETPAVPIPPPAPLAIEDPPDPQVAELPPDTESPPILPPQSLQAVEPEQPPASSWVRADSRLVPGPHIAGLDLNDLTSARLDPLKENSAASQQFPDQRPFDFLNEASAVELARFLEQESSQVVAVVFSRLDPTVAAEVLKRLPETLQVDVVQRLKSLDEISEEVTREIEESLQVWFADQMRRSQRRNAGQKAVQQILNIAGHKTRRRIEQRVHAAVPRPTEPPAKRTTDSHVAPLACSFQTVLEMDDGALSQVFSAADPRDAVLALAGSERQFIDRVLRNLKPRDADRLRKAFQGLDASQLNDVAGSQQKIAELAGTMRKKNRRAASASSPVASA